MTTKDVRIGDTYFIVSKGPGLKAVADWPLSGAVAASGAAPIYFPPVAGNLIDGGVGVNANPCLAVAVEAMEYIGAAEGFIDNHVILISLGTGYVPYLFGENAADHFWLKNWIEYVILKGLDDAALQQASSTRAIYGNRIDFRRYNPELTPENLTDALGIEPKHRPDQALARFALAGAGRADGGNRAGVRAQDRLEHAGADALGYRRRASQAQHQPRQCRLVEARRSDMTGHAFLCCLTTNNCSAIFNLMVKYRPLDVVSFLGAR